MGSEEADDALSVFRGCNFHRGGMLRSRHDPKFLRAACRPVDPLGVTAGNDIVVRAADQKDGKRALGHRIFRRILIGIEPARFC